MDMDLNLSVGLNLPGALLGLAANVFYIFCFIFPSGGEMNVRQPLLSLLVLMIVCSILFQLSLILHLVLELTSFVILRQAMQILIFYIIRISIPTTVWLNIYYCSQIVPVRNALFVWLKKHIKMVMCLFFTSSSVYFLVYFVLEYWMEYGLPPMILDPLLNNTNANETNSLYNIKRQISQIVNTLDTVTMALILLGLIIMLTATGSTAQYLYRHIKKMRKSGIPFNSQPLLNQVRVTVTGLVQGVLFLFCSTAMFLDVYTNYHKLNLDRNILWTLFSLYSLTTTVNLGVGQSLFRQRVVQLWRMLFLA